ncbi:MAG: PF20097 family protein [Phycisphaeraceae bacterium JB051]
MKCPNCHADMITGCLKSKPGFWSMTIVPERQIWSFYPEKGKPVKIMKSTSKKPAMYCPTCGLVVLQNRK